MDNRAIGMFDSGVGGITVLKECLNLMPNENTIYIGDTASFPYGSKSKQTIIELTKKQIENLIEKDVKLIVIACGTATSQALKEVQRMFSVPIIGIIQPTVKYLKENKIDNIGVIATTGTIRSQGWQKELEGQIENCIIKSKACPLLAPMAEEGWTDNQIAELTIHEYLKNMENIQALILGCTHYPLFQSIIQKELPNKTKVINTGKMVAHTVKEYIKDNNLENNQLGEKFHQIYLTDTECNFINVAKKLLPNPELTGNIQKI